MANRSIVKVKFEPETMRHLISKIGISREELANKINRDARSLYRYIKNGEMPIHIYDVIVKLACDAVPESEVEDKNTRINRMITKLSDIGLSYEQILGEVTKSLAGVHPNMVDDEFEIIQEVRFK